MTEQEKNNEMLSFEELRKKLNMDNPSADNETNADFEKLVEDIENGGKTKSTDDFSGVEIEKVDSIQPKIITENGKDFVDITEQYVKKPVNSVDDSTVKDNQKSKKKVRTFNEIFSDFFKGFIPLKKDSAREKIRKIVMDISIVAIICCAFAFVDLIKQYNEQLQKEDDTKEMIVETDEMDDNQYVQAWQELFAQYPDIQFPEGMNLRYSYLYAINQDLVGWLRIGNTNLDVQVVQADDNDYYLRRDFYKKTSRYGCPYLDFKNDPRYLDDNTVIYGHHMTDGLMFSNLDKYKTLEGYKDSPIIEYNTLYDTYYFKVFAAFITNAEAEQDEGYIFNFTVTDFTTDEKFNGFIKEVEKRSIFNSGIKIQPDDKIITLATCSYEFHEARLVVMGKLIREGEETTVDTSGATLNTSPKYPQAWYDAKSTTNPYSADEDWMP